MCTSAWGPLYLFLEKEFHVDSKMTAKFLPEFLNPSLESVDISGPEDIQLHDRLNQKAENISLNLRSL